MSVPRLKSSDSESRRSTWFQDVKTGCEKQTDYFLRIRKLQKELINREQHNLVNAMERLKQLQYPRRKPFVRNFEVPPIGSKCFPTRPLNTRRDSKHRLHQEKEFEELKPLKGQVLLPNKAQADDEANMEPFTLDEIKRIYSMLPIMNDKQIARIVHDVRTTFPNEPSTYLLQPHLPSIPNVPRKANRRLDNRLKLLTLTESSCSIGSSSSIPNIPSTISHKRIDVSKDAEKQKQRKCERKKGKKIVLAFDVDPNDSSVFSNCLSTSRDVNEDGSPSPPPNSRPTSRPTDAKIRDASGDVPKADLKNEPSEAPNNSNKELAESEYKIVKEAVELNKKIQEETQNFAEGIADGNNDSNQIKDEGKKQDKQSQQEVLPEETVKGVESVESLEDLSENKSENASIILTEPVVKITRKESATLKTE